MGFIFVCDRIYETQLIHKSCPLTEIPLLMSWWFINSKNFQLLDVDISDIITKVWL